MDVVHGGLEKGEAKVDMVPADPAKLVVPEITGIPTNLRPLAIELVRIWLKFPPAGIFNVWKDRKSSYFITLVGVLLKYICSHCGDRSYMAP